METADVANHIRALDIKIDIKSRELSEAQTERDRVVGEIVEPYIVPSFEELVMVSFVEEG